MRRTRILAATVVTGLVITGLYAGRNHIPGLGWLSNRVSGKSSVADRVAQFGPAARERWAPYFAKAGVPYPPARLFLVGLKAEKELEVYAAGAGQDLKLVRRMPVLKASGKLGPKLKEGDLQVPEGVYRIESLNPNSNSHLSLRVNYPSEEDRRLAAAEGRTKLGGNIMIHGGHVSVGCLAIGDEGSEDMFVLAAEKWPQEIPLVICPWDFRVHRGSPAGVPRLAWLPGRYEEIKAALKGLPAAGGTVQVG